MFVLMPQGIRGVLKKAEAAAGNKIPAAAFPLTTKWIRR
jgi:hypothetical protein